MKSYPLPSLACLVLVLGCRDPGQSLSDQSPIEPAPASIPAEPAPPLPTQPESPILDTTSLIGPPTLPPALLADWPENLPYPPGLDFEVRSRPDDFMVTIEARHPAPYSILASWFINNLSDRGWFVLARDRLGASLRFRLGQQRQRWTLHLHEHLDEAGHSSTALTLRRQYNEESLSSLPGGYRGTQCQASIPAQPQPTPLACRFELGQPLDQIPPDAQGVAFAIGPNRDALVFISQSSLMVATLNDTELESSPRTIAQLTHTEPDSAALQILPFEQGWLLSWLDGHPTERVVLTLDQHLDSHRGPARLSFELHLFKPAGWAALPDRGVLAAWSEGSEELAFFRSARFSSDGMPQERVGRWPVMGAIPTLGPLLAAQPEGEFALVWGSSDGIHLRPLGLDGFPSGDVRLLEPGEPRWLETLSLQDSYWIIWATARSGFWLRADPTGCLDDDARGSLNGIPTQVFNHRTGVLVQVRDGNRARLLRITDRYGERPSRAPELLASSGIPFHWSHFDSFDGGARGVVRTDNGFATAAWLCDDTP